MVCMREREFGTTKEEINLVDVDTSNSLLSGLTEPDKLPIFPIMAAFCNPLMQCHERMVAAGICTVTQAERGLEELKRRIAGYHELRDNRGEGSTIEERIQHGNEWDNYKRIRKLQFTPEQRSEIEWDTFESWCIG